MGDEITEMKTGDIILLKIPPEPGTTSTQLVYCDGAVGSDPQILEFEEAEQLTDIRNCLFQVTFRLSYHAQKDLDRARKKGAEEAELGVLQEKLDNETQQNKDFMKDHDPVKYGDTIQLMHVKSGKFVRVQPRQTAPTERRARAVVLDKGNTHAAFTLQAFYKYKYQGEPVLFDQQVLLKASKLGQQWGLHVSKKPLPKSTTHLHWREWNCSTDFTGVFPILYCRPNIEIMSYSNCVRFYHNQQERMLGASCATAEMNTVVTRSTPPGPKRPFMRCLKSDNIDHVSNLWAKGIWLLEALDPMEGGYILWKSKLRIKHIGTNKYLGLDRSAKALGGKAYLGMLKDSPDDDCVFMLDAVEEPEDEEVMLSRGSVKALLKFTGSESLWLSCYSDQLKIDNDQSQKPSYKIFFSSQRRIRETLQVTVLDTTNEDFVLLANRICSWRVMCLEAAKRLKDDKKVHKASMAAPDNPTKEQIFQQEDNIRMKRQLFDKLDKTISAAICLITGESEDVLTDALDAPPTSVEEVQELVRALKFVDASFVAFKALWDAGYKVTQLTAETQFNLSGTHLKKRGSKDNLGGGGGGGGGDTIEEDEWRVLRLLVEFWRTSFQDVRSNENYFDRNGWIHTINGINGLGLGAAETLSELTNNNMNIAKQIDQETMQSFADFIGDLGPDKTWLVFMRSVCSCAGKAIANNQELILRMMYDPGKFASKIEKEKWGQNRTKYLLSLRVGDPIGRFPPLPDHIVEAEFIGKHTMLHSLCDILCSWDSRQDVQWEMFKDWIYYHPNHLTLNVVHHDSKTNRAWVSLADVTWVLSPDILYEMVNSDQPADAWKHQGPLISKTGRFGALKVLAGYCLAQIHLLAEMCLDRQINCINSMSREYSFEMISYAMWNPMLPGAMRSAFCRLFDTLWLNKPPHSEKQLPQLVYKWSDLSTLPTLPIFELLEHSPSNGSSDADTCAALPSKFNLMVAYCCSHLAQLRGRMVYSDEGSNEQTASAADLVHNLFYFGLIASKNTLCVLLNLLLKATDGRTDWLEIPTAKEEAEEGSPDLDRSATRGSVSEADEPLLGAQNGSSSGVFSCCGSGGGTAVQGSSSDTGVLVPLYYSIKASDTGADRYKGGTTPASGAGMAPPEIVVEAKIRLLCAVKEIVEIIQNDDLQSVIAVFHRLDGKVPTVGEFDIIARDVVQAVSSSSYDFNKLGGMQINTMLIDLMMYEHMDVFRLSLTIMWAISHRLRTAIGSCETVNLLVENEDIKTYDEMKTDVGRLSNLLNTFEDWGLRTPFSPLEDTTYKDVGGILGRLRQMCSEGGVGNDSDMPDTQRQDMLANLGLGKVALYAFNFPISDLKRDIDTKNLLITLMTQVCQLLVQYVNDNPRNQKAIFRNLDDLMTWFPEGIGVANVVAATFIENVELCELLPKDIVYTFGQVLTQNREEGGKGFLPHQLSFLQSCVVVGQHPVVRNKAIVIEMLKNPSYAAVLHLMPNEESKPPKGIQRSDTMARQDEAQRKKAALQKSAQLTDERRSQLLQNFTSWSELTKPQMFRSWKGDDAEIQYHSTTLELLAALCIGRDKTGCTEFVQFLVPARTLATSYLSIDKVQAEEAKKAGGGSMNCRRMCRALKRSFLLLLESAYYNTELVDQVFLSSLMHLQVLQCISSEMKRDLRPLKDGEMTSVGEQFIFQALRTVNSLLEFTDPKQWQEDIGKCIKQDFQPVLTELNDPNIGVRSTSNTLFKNVVGRALAWITGDEEKMTTRLVDLGPREGTATDDEDGVAINAALKDFATKLADSESVKLKIAEEHMKMIQHIANISEVTNPGNAEYKAIKKAGEKAGVEMKVDYRRDQIQLEDFVTRAVSHCLEGDNLKDSETLELVFQTISDMLLNTKNPELLMATEEKVGSDVEPLDMEVFLAQQVKFAECGAVDLFIQTLMMRPEPNIVNEALQLAILLLEPRNEDVQGMIEKKMYSTDDSGVWEVIGRVYMEVEANVKSIRGMKALQRKSGDDVMTEDELALLESFEEDLKICARTVYMMKLFCEGHNFKMQQYIFRQVDNTQSTNFVEKTSELLLKLCKNENASNMVDTSEMECLLQVCDLLVELITGPAPQNQLFLSVAGLVEGVQKIQQGVFKLLRLSDEDLPGDAYPPQVRSCKARLTNAVLALLELRPNRDVHQNVIFRMDGAKMKQRLVFCHRWFCSKYCTDASPGVERAAHIADEDGVCLIDSMDQDDGVVIPTADPVSLMDKFDEGEVSELFDEPFNVVMLMHELSPYSDKFKETVDASPPKFIDDVSLFVSPAAYQAAKKAAQNKEKYIAAYVFFDRWINTIEIVIDRRVFELHFRTPVTCDFVLGRTKQSIQETVDIGSTEDKLKDFTEQCGAAFSQTEHTLVLSKWSPSICRCLKNPPKPLNFFLKNDSKNLMMISDLCLGLAAMVNLTLIYGLVLVPQKGAKAEDWHGSIAFATPEWETAVQLQAGLYFLMMTTSFMVMVVTYSPLDYADAASTCQGGPTRYATTLFALMVVGVAFLGPFLQGHTGLGVVIAVVLLLQIGGFFSSNCPNNTLAKMLVAMKTSFGKEDIYRRFFFVLFALLGMAVQPWWLSFLLLDILWLSPMLQNVVKAVTVPIEALSLTTVCGFMVMYEYAMLAFYYFRHEYAGTCQTTIDCTMTTIYIGLRMDIGSGISATHVFDADWYPRMAFDLSYFVIISTVLMNVIFGIILDQFGSLRDETSERISYFKNTTFIACLDRSDVEAVALEKGISNGWEYLEGLRGRHHKWKYLNFIFYLNTKDPTEFLGHESIIFDLLQDGETSWLPANTCKLMQEIKDAEGGDEIQLDVGTVMKSLRVIRDNHTDLFERFEGLIAQAEEKEEEKEEEGQENIKKTYTQAT